VCRAERQVVQDGCHHSEKCIGVRSVGVEDHLTASVLISVELTDVALLDGLGQQGLGLADDLPLLRSAGR
jgi:hypothetical protein